MKKAFILIILFAFGCKEESSLLRPPGEAVFTLGEPTSLSNNFTTKAIKASDLIGKWKLTDSKFKFERGTINNIAGYFEFSDEKQIMIFGANDINKLIFYNPPCFINGTHNRFTDSTITSFTWTPASGHPAKTVYINYSNNMLTLYYCGYLFIHNKYYGGSVYEVYIKN